MKGKLFIGWLLLSLIFVGSAVALSSCSNDDDDLKGGVYKGKIENLRPDLVTLKLTYSPYNTKDDMPRKKDVIFTSGSDFANLNVKEGQKISFRVVSAQRSSSLFTQPVGYECWDCEIEIIKLY